MARGLVLVRDSYNGKIYDMRITGNTIRFDKKFYKVTDSIAKEIVKEIKAENIGKEWTTSEISELFKRKTDEDCTLITCASIYDFAYERVEAILYTDSKEGYVHVAFMDKEGNMQHCGVEATIQNLHIGKMGKLRLKYVQRMV